MDLVLPTFAEPTAHNLATGLAGRGYLDLGGDARLAHGRVHEVTGHGADVFAVLAAAHWQRDTVWIGLKRDQETLCPMGLQAYIDPARVLLVQGVSHGELIWAAEQVLRAEGAFCVVLDLPGGLSLNTSRRLQLCAEQSGALGLVLVRGRPETSASQTRWQCTPVAGDEPAWLWQCIKGRQGEKGAWKVHFRGGQNAKDTLHLAATAAA